MSDGLIPMGDGFLWIGAITKPYGLRGHLKVQADPGSGESFQPGGRIYARQDKEQTEFVISEAQARDNHFILRFAGVEDRSGAEALVGRSLYVREESLGTTPRGGVLLVSIDRIARGQRGGAVFRFVGRSDLHAGSRCLGGQGPGKGIFDTGCSRGDPFRRSRERRDKSSGAAGIVGG
ncbi:MAG: hypothetical protein EHM75_06210 [Desulfobacteraceae bacterium]|nr:MAG: hypothetical protein EHM75_06210 [Desulfobacteraceae bacterium]